MVLAALVVLLVPAVPVVPVVPVVLVVLAGYPDYLVSVAVEPSGPVLADGPDDPKFSSGTARILYTLTENPLLTSC